MGLAGPTESVGGVVSLVEWKEARRVTFTLPWPSCPGGRSSRPEKGLLG